MPWITTENGKHVNTDWFDKERQINANKKEADKRNSEDAKSNTKDRYEKAPGLIYGVARINDKFIDIDGYSNKSTEKGMLSELAKTVERYDKAEADGIRDMVKFNEISQSHYNKQDGGNQFICEWEEVPSASRYVDKNGKDSILSGNEGVDIESRDGKYYVHIRIPRR